MDLVSTVKTTIKLCRIDFFRYYVEATWSAPARVGAEGFLRVIAEELGWELGLTVALQLRRPHWFDKSIPLTDAETRWSVEGSVRVTGYASVDDIYYALDQQRDGSRVATAHVRVHRNGIPDVGLNTVPVEFRVNRDAARDGWKLGP
jgi:hypothetical protein